MRNLKRALSLALAAIMLIGMMVVSACAVSYNDLTDKDPIVNKDAVSMLVSLGIIEGKPDGSYAPTENVDRAQMAKMLSVIMNKGVDNSALYQSVNSGLTDITSNWAKGHINYCYTTGIIAGRGNGTFDPSATVTALEAAKMLLVAVGYDPKIEGFEGADWAINVSVRADEQGIFEGFTKDLSAPPEPRRRGPADLQRPGRGDDPELHHQQLPHRLQRSPHHPVRQVRRDQGGGRCHRQ